MTIGCQEVARNACDAFLATPLQSKIAGTLLAHGINIHALLLGLAVRRDRDAHSQLLRLHHSLGREADEGGVEHHLLIAVARANIPKVDALPVSETTRRDILDALVALTSPGEKLRSRLRIGHSWFRSAALIVMLERYPGGAFEWEVSGVPRSWLLRIEKRKLPELLRLLWKETGGFYPFFSPHLSILREPGSRLEAGELLKSYLEMARGMECQPQIKGMLAASWLYDRSMGAISPHIHAVMHQPIIDGQGFFADIGAVDPWKSGALSKSKRRRALYDEGKYRPRSGMVLWPRDKMIRWASDITNPSDAEAG